LQHIFRAAGKQFHGRPGVDRGRALLLRQANGKINLFGHLTACFTGLHSPVFRKHQLSDMLTQRIYGLSMGQVEDIAHKQLRCDSAMAALRASGCPKHAL